MRTTIALLLALGAVLAGSSCGYNYDALMGDAGSISTVKGGEAGSHAGGSSGSAGVSGTAGDIAPTGMGGLSGTSGSAGVGAGGGVEPTGVAGNGSIAGGGGRGGGPAGTGGVAGSAGRAGQGGAAAAGRGGAAGAGRGGASGAGATGAAGVGGVAGNGNAGRGGSAGGSAGATGRGGAAGSAAGSTGRGGAEVEPGLPTPYARYSFDQTSGTKITDVTGHGHDGTAVGNSLGFGTGIIGNDLSLNGAAGSYVSLPIGLVQSLSDMTIAFWVLVHSDTMTDRWQRVFDFGSNTNLNMYFTPHSAYADTARFSITTGGSTVEQQLNNPGPLPVNSWTHVTIVINAGTGTLYINSIPTVTNFALTLKPSSLGATSNNWLGRSQYSADPAFNGEIDDFRIYSTALNPGQVSTLFLLR